MKAGKKVDFSENKCPMKEKCPYYKDFKDSGDSEGCPVKKGCPRKLMTKKKQALHSAVVYILYIFYFLDFKKEGHHTDGDKPDASECPYLKKKAAADSKSKCPLAGKCP